MARILVETKARRLGDQARQILTTNRHDWVEITRDADEMDSEGRKSLL